MSEIHPKHATPDHPIHDLIAQRWSPYAFAPRPIPEEDLEMCLEAARWAPSSYNDQPWSFLLARRQDEEAFERLLGCLNPGNQAWARDAGALLLTVVRRAFHHNGKPNKACEHDIGLAAATLSVQATALGLHVHQMIGIDPDKARETYGVPEGHDVLTAIAIGYADTSRDRQDELAGRDAKSRSRRPLAETVFSGAWGHPAFEG